MGQPPLAAKSRLGTRDGAHEIVGIEAAFDERLHFAVPREGGGALRSSERIIRRIDDLEA